MPTRDAKSRGRKTMHSFATWPLQSNTFVFPDKYNDRKPKPAKDPAKDIKVFELYLPNKKEKNKNDNHKMNEYAE